MAIGPRKLFFRGGRVFEGPFTLKLRFRLDIRESQRGTKRNELHQRSTSIHIHRKENHKQLLENQQKCKQTYRTDGILLGELDLTTGFGVAHEDPRQRVKDGF